MKQASRLWVQKYARPRDEHGRYLAGRQLWTRESDGETRWIHFLHPDDSELRTRAFDDDALRHFLVLCFVVVVAVLLASFVR